MARLVLLNLLLLALPTALYTAYFYITQRSQAAGAIDWKKMPLRTLLQAGFGLIALAMLVTAYTEGDDPGGTYIPARMQDGKLIPGRVE